MASVSASQASVPFVPTLTPLRRIPLRAGCRALAVATALLLAIAAAGCGEEKGAATENAASAAEFAELREQAEGARDAATAAGADTGAPEIFEKGVEYLAKAEELEADPTASSKTKAQYKRAKEKFEESVVESGKRKGKVDELATELAALEKLRDEVKAAGGDQVDAATFAKGEQDLADAKAASAAGDLAKAKREVRYGTDSFKAVQRQAAMATQQRTLADEEKALCAANKAKAAAAGAEKLAPQDWQWASDQERDGTAAYDAKDYDRAVALFRQSKGAYLSAATYAEELSKKPAVAEADSSAGRPREDIPKVDEIKIPELAGDEIDLSDLPTLFGGAATYKDSKLEIDWASGLEFQKDLQILVGKPENIIFEGEAGVGVGENDYVMAGNTIGLVLINAGFEDGVSVKATIKFQMVVSKAFFEIVVMAADANNFYASEFATNVKINDDGNGYVKAASTDPLHHKQYKDWVNLREPYELEVKFVKTSEEEEGEIRCYLNGVETCRYKTDKFRKGRVGFRWSNTKFVIRDLQVRGLPDEEWALEAIKKKRAEAGKKPVDDDFGF